MEKGRDHLVTSNAPAEFVGGPKDGETIAVMWPPALEIHVHIFHNLPPFLDRSTPNTPLEIHTGVYKLTTEDVVERKLLEYTWEGY